MSIFFTSDTHFQHDNIIKYSNRPFANVEAMNETIIRRWNEVVGQGDTVWHLGDFCMGNQRNAAHLRSRLNGTIHLVWGNHDKREIIEDLGCFDSMQDVGRIWIGKEFVYLSHYGHRVWEGSHKGSYQLYGHSHGGLDPIARSLDVGVDSWDYRPISFDDIKRRLKSLDLLDRVTPHNHR